MKYDNRRLHHWLYASLTAALAEFTSTLLLTFLIVLAYFDNFFKNRNRDSKTPPTYDQEEQQYALKASDSFVHSLDSFQVRDYALAHGFGYEEHYAITADKHILHLHRIFDPKKLESSHFSPLIIQHGLFQSSGVFVTNEHDSMAFYFAEQGYDVWLGNNRAVVPGHVEISEQDEEYWNWGLDELAKYDFPAIVNYVSQHTGFDQVMFAGHSQGAAQVFLALSHHPELNGKLKLFIAMAPAYYICNINHWALQLMFRMPDKFFYMLFGRKAFVPAMNFFQRVLNPHMFASLAYQMFCYLFNWADTLWIRSRKRKYFMFTPRPTSCKILRHWGLMIKAGKVVSMDPSIDCTLKNIRCPTMVVYGADDSMVDGGKLAKELKSLNSPVHFVHSVEGYEHMDLLWGRDAKSRVFIPLAQQLAQFHRSYPNKMNEGYLHRRSHSAPRNERL